MNSELLHKTVWISFIIQIITNIISLYSFTIVLKPKDYILQNINYIETVVQFIEAIWYIYIAYSFYSINTNNIASIRYIDWIITTPIMLISTILYMEYENNKIKKNYDKVTIKNIYDKHKYTILKIILFNFLMLLFGYLGETNILSKYYSILIGFIFFFLSFYTIWIHFAIHSNISSNLFIFLFITWILYGFAAMLHTIPKNISYNILDIIAKNFYGLFIVYKIIEINKSYKKFCSKIYN